ncbi:MAG: adenylate kinase [Rhodobacter sp.]|nr:adenylate kinase [Rhodobacter sp.]
MPRRIHILGASGTGTSTLARGLASALGSQAFDTDDFYWLPTDPPFTDKRPAADRLALMETMFLPRSDWLLSGSMTRWGDPVIPRLTHVIFLTMAAGPRLARLRRRERQRYGALIRAGGTRAGAFKGFLDWAMAYDDPDFAGRSRHQHEAWLFELTCPVIRLDAAMPPEDLLAAALDALDGDKGAL